MEQMEKQGTSKENQKISFEDAWEELQRIFNVLEALDFRVVEHRNREDIFKRNWEDRFAVAVPVACDGADGIRVVRQRNGHYMVTFTNGFENPNDPERIKVVDALQAKGIDVVDLRK